MYDFVRKVIAKEGKREYVNSSFEEMEEFIVKRRREDFKSKDIICIKFEEASSEDFDDVQSSSWFINPYYVKNISSLIEDENEKLIASFVDDENNIETFMYPDAYGPKMASEFLPELLLTDAFWQDNRFSEKYAEFYNKNMTSQLSDQDFLNSFFEFLKAYPKY